MKPVLICGVLLIALGAAAILDKPLGYFAYRASFTLEGCEWAQANGIKVQREAQTCRAIVRFRPHSVAEGGYIRLEDDRVVDATTSLLLSLEKVDTELEDTPGQTAAVKHLLLVFVSVILSVAVIVFFPTRKKHGTEDTRKHG